MLQTYNSSRFSNRYLSSLLRKICLIEELEYFICLALLIYQSSMSTKSTHSCSFCSEIKNFLHTFKYVQRIKEFLIWKYLNLLPLLLWQGRFSHTKILTRSTKSDCRDNHLISPPTTNTTTSTLTLLCCFSALPSRHRRLSARFQSDISSPSWK